MANNLISYVNTHSQYEPNEVLDLLLPMTRNEVIAFLAWNDPNGFYTDLDSLKEDRNPLTECEAKLMAFKILWENSVN